ncbi:hypothetical protein [Halobacillus litoralis]|uniref:hypothetical protein n=1 Tax=Halobacillus litoralis TaxID=45668 RepID=UPI001CD3FE16|nr:hypothetical protein [Halobacillus litoralis]MCA1022464.1 hypothetical protein [Halobacillus litoralis]
MKQLTFSSYEELEEFLKHKFREKAAYAGLPEKDIRQMTGYKDRAQQLWEENNCAEVIEREGEVTLDVWLDVDGKRHIKRGRPRKKTEDKLTRSLHVRLDEESFKKLERYAEDHGMDRSTAVRTILKKM